MKMNKVGHGFRSAPPPCLWFLPTKGISKLLMSFLLTLMRPPQKTFVRENVKPYDVALLCCNAIQQEVV